MFVFFSPWYYFTSAHYFKLLCFFAPLYYGRLSSLSLFRAVWCKVKNSELPENCSSTCCPLFLSLAGLPVSLKYHTSISLLYLRGSGTRLPLGVALSQSLFASLYCVSVRLHHVRKTFNIIFICRSTLSSLTQGQSLGCVKSSSCLLLGPAGLRLQGTNSAILYISSS